MTVANINKMIDYCIKMPDKDEYESGHRYPYYSCELLCSFNGLNIDRLIETYNEEQNNESLNNNENKEEEKKKEIIMKIRKKEKKMFKNLMKKI